MPTPKLTQNEAREVATDLAEVAGRTAFAAAQLARWDPAAPDIFLINAVKVARLKMEAAWEKLKDEASD